MAAKDQMECFRLDESGYTGFDLLNAEQPFQGAAAIAITNDEAARLVKEHFPNLQAVELKYGALARRTANHPRLLSLLKTILSDYKCVTYVCDKRYLLLLMFLDYAVEPFYYERGLDFYKDGQNYALASLLSFAGPTLLGQAEFNAMLAAFQRAVKEKTPEALNNLVVAVRATRWKKLPAALGPLAQYESTACLASISTPGVSTDAAFIVLGSLISRMEVMANGPYFVEHDQSQNLLTYHDLLQRYINHDELVEFRQSEIASLKFPLKLTSVTQVDSKQSPAVQLADVMIGATIGVAMSLTGRRTIGFNPTKLLLLNRDEQLIHLLASVNFEEQRRFREGTQASEVIDYFARNFYGNGKSV